MPPGILKTVQEITGLAVPDQTAVSLKDFADANGLDLEIIRPKIIEALTPATDAAEPGTEPEPAEEAPQVEEPAREEPATPAEAPETTALDIKGSTSITAVLEAGLTAEQFTEITGLAVPEEASMRLKDFVDANGLDMETVRTKIVEMLAQ